MIYDLGSGLESDIWDSTDWGRKWVVDFNAVAFNSSVIAVKMDVSVCLLRCWDFLF